MKAVDVVIAARNEAQMLGRCLDALASQDYPSDRIRVLVVDNGSTDGTAEIAEGRGYRVLREPRRGAAVARNRGMAAGSGELVACLDAHCLPSANWVSAMAGAFDHPAVGGAQARIVNRGLDPRVDAYLTASRRYANSGMLDDTVNGRFSLYPWVLSGNSMVRRDVVARLGGYDESLLACEDVDLGWRIVLEGLLLVPVDAAVGTHWDPAPWTRFLRKGWRYGRGAAQLARAYAAHGARRTLRPRKPFSGPAAQMAGGLLYAAGHWAESIALTLGRPLTASRPAGLVPEEARRPFPWDGAGPLQISRGVVFWFSGSTALVVDLGARHRYVLDAVGGMVWRQLAEGRSREETIGALVGVFGIARQTAEADLDDLLGELLEAGIVLRRLAGPQVSLGPYGRT